MPVNQEKRVFPRPDYMIAQSRKLRVREYPMSNKECPFQNFGHPGTARVSAAKGANSHLDINSDSGYSGPISHYQEHEGKNMSSTIDVNEEVAGQGTATNPLGAKLLEAGLITRAQLETALERQRSQGGRLGDNLIELGFISLETFTGFLRKHPGAPKSIEETGLNLSFIAELTLKHILFMGEFRFSEVTDRLKLPISVIDPAVEFLQRNKFVEVKGASQYVRATYKFALTELGRKRAAELMEICSYVGPAPVTLEAYRKMVEVQTIKNVSVSQEILRRAFSEYVVSEKVLRRLGPAVISGKSIFLYGPPGNGKTTLAETIGKTLGETVYIPYSIIVGGEIIRLFDPTNHTPATPELNVEAVDQRWIFIKRPVVITGGELTLKTLDLEFDPVAKFSMAPLQMKANNGIFIIDDFGRQAIEPKQLLNRWIVPLERRVDFMTLHSGTKFEIPFDELIIFSTNLEPENLVDEAFLRRIRYKIKVTHPTQEELESIFMRVCSAKGVPFDKEVFNFLWQECYEKYGIAPNACHPRDLIDFVIDDARYYRRNPRLTREVILEAWRNYYMEK
jgi:hypothetical protein